MSNNLKYNIDEKIAQKKEQHRREEAEELRHIEAEYGEILDSGFMRRRPALRQLVELFMRFKPYLILTIVPLLFTCAFAGAMSPVSNSDLPVLIYDMDRSNEARLVVDQFAAYPYIDIDESPRSMGDIEEAMLAGRALGAVIIPEGFGQSLKAQQGAELLVLQDATNFMNVSTLMQASTQVVGTVNAAIRVKLLEAGGMLPGQAMANVTSLSVVDRGLYNPTYGYLFFLFPGLLAIFVQQPFLAAASPYLIEQKQLLARGRGSIGALAARLVRFMLVAVLGLLLCLFALCAWFNYPMRGELGLVLLVLAPFLLAICGMTLLIAAIFDDPAHCTQFNMFLTIPTFLTCGFAWPEYMMPELFREVVIRIWPLYYLANPLRDIILKGGDFAMVAPYVEGCLWFAAFWLPAGLAAYFYKLYILHRVEA